MDARGPKEDARLPQPPTMSAAGDLAPVLQHTPKAQPFPHGTGPSVRYIAEGMANIVFSFPRAKGNMRDLLIRVPKEVTGSYDDIHRHWCQHIYPLFRPVDLVPQYLVALDGTANSHVVRSAIEKELASAEKDKGRPVKFRGSKLKKDIRDAMLIRNMRPRDGKEKLIEFKPKWLAQSPTAPAGAKRCRNCAREALRTGKKGEGDGPILCPLRLLDRDSPESMRIACDILTAGQEAVFAEGSRELGSLREWLLTNELLPRLRDAQVANDTVGVLEPKDTFSLGRAMTLRDCTCYLRLAPGGGGGGGGGNTEARLGDLDLKDQGTKLEYWRNMELELIDGGWYMGTEKPRVETTCLLEA